jgi:signal transduction histidine kinase
VVQTAIESIDPRPRGSASGSTSTTRASTGACATSRKLYQVFLNLLDNAIKYSDPGDRVDVSIMEEASSLTVRVRDTGVGIPDEDLNQLFERFYRVDKDRSRATGGSGLGLAISKQIIEMHGGTISVEERGRRGLRLRDQLPKAPLSRSISHAL